MNEDDGELRSLPPGVSGEIRGYFVLEIGELLFRAKNHDGGVGDVGVEPVWWGHDGKNAVLSTANAPAKDRVRPSRIRYPVRCPLHVFRKYLAEMGRLDLKIRSCPSSSSSTSTAPGGRRRIPGRLVGVVSVSNLSKRVVTSSATGGDGGGEYFPVTATTATKTAATAASSDLNSTRDILEPAGYLFVRVGLEPSESSAERAEPPPPSASESSSLPSRDRPRPKGILVAEKGGEPLSDGPKTSGLVSRAFVERRPSPPRRIVESVPVGVEEEPSLIDRLLSAETLHVELSTFRFDRVLVTDYVEDLSPTKRPGRRLPSSVSAVFAEVRAPDAVLRKMGGGGSAGVGRLSARDIRDGAAKFSGKPASVSFPVSVRDLGVLRGALVEVAVTGRVLGVRMPVSLGVARFDLGRFLADGAAEVEAAVDVECDERLVSFQKARRPLSLFKRHLGRLDAKFVLSPGSGLGRKRLQSLQELRVPKEVHFDPVAVEHRGPGDDAFSRKTEEEEDEEDDGSAAEAVRDVDRTRFVEESERRRRERHDRETEELRAALDRLRTSAHDENYSTRGSSVETVRLAGTEPAKLAARRTVPVRTSPEPPSESSEEPRPREGHFEIPKEVWYLCVALREARHLADEDSDACPSSRSFSSGAGTAASDELSSYFAVVRVGSRENVFPTKTVWRCREPDFDFRVRVPFLPSPEFLKSLATNCVVVEVWRKPGLPVEEARSSRRIRADEDVLLGVARVPLRLAAFCLEQRNALSLLSQSETPSVLVDGFIPVEGLATSSVVGEVRLHVSVGTAAQVGFYLNSVTGRSSAGSTEIGVQAAVPSPPRPSSPVPPPSTGGGGHRSELPPGLQVGANKLNLIPSADDDDGEEEEPRTEPFSVDVRRGCGVAVVGDVFLQGGSRRGERSFRRRCKPGLNDGGERDEAMDLRVRPAEVTPPSPSPPPPTSVPHSLTFGTAAPSPRVRLKVRVLRGMAVELPSPQDVDSGPTPPPSSSVVPNVYVSVADPKTGRVEVSPACVGSAAPVWDWGAWFDLPSVDSGEEVEYPVVKVWSISPKENFFLPAGTLVKWMPREDDVMLGKVTPDLASVVRGGPGIDGWFQIASPTHKLPRGLLKLGFHLENPSSSSSNVIGNQEEECLRFLSRSSSEVHVPRDRASVGMSYVRPSSPSRRTSAGGGGDDDIDERRRRTSNVPSLLPIRAASTSASAEPSVSGVSVDSAFYSCGSRGRGNVGVRPGAVAGAASSPLDEISDGEEEEEEDVEDGAEERRQAAPPSSSSSSSLGSPLSEKYFRPSAST